MSTTALKGRFDAIVIGASAGAIEVLLALLPTLPRDFALPILIVVHLPRGQPSLLVEVFTQRCALPVTEASDKEPVAPGTIYFAPADYHLLIEEGPRFALSADELVHYSRPSVDVLFESAADVYRERLLGVILSGANQDGASGLAAVHAAGGMTVVQAPETADAPQMPTAALQSCPVDFTLRVSQLVELFSTLEMSHGD